MSPAILDRCVREVKRKNKKVNPWAVCKASLHLTKKKHQKHKE